jgi:hypothetical protein
VLFLEEDVASDLVALVDDALNFLVNELASGFGVGPELVVLLLVGTQPHALAHAVHRHQALSDLGDLLDVVGRTCRYLPEKQLFTHSTTQCSADHILELLFAVQG